jgi:hypothetical protein
MRTTLTLDPDVAIRIERMRRARELSFKELVNDAIRLGLDQLDRPPAASRSRYATTGWDLGRCRLTDLDDVASALAFGEGEHYK